MQSQHQGLEGTLRAHLEQQPAQVGSARADFSGLCHLGLTVARMEIFRLYGQSFLVFYHSHYIRFLVFRQNYMHIPLGLETVGLL